ncbi:hypothetical protein [Paludibacterium purpuratum]|uniref:hypothetical protein n=1 Tax=Paludibacterium purpuratum TaxID=1144873 RepID=UPI00105D11B4|nr:hypothetical protein [Paludibacterium purpuratum]
MEWLDMLLEWLEEKCKGVASPATPGEHRSELVFAALGEKPGIVAVVGTLSNLLLPGPFRFVELWLGHSIQKAFMLVARLFAAHAEGDTRNHPGTSLSVDYQLQPQNAGTPVPGSGSIRLCTGYSHEKPIRQ